MTHDLTPLLREAADALWLIPTHAGLAQRLTHATERTRPSEAEVEAAWKKAYADIGAGEVDFPPNQWARAFAAALSTPRPSEAEVIAKVTEAFVVELRAEWADAGCKTPMQVEGGCDCPDCVLANTVCAALDLVIQHRATPPLAPEVTAEKVALIEALRDAMKVGVPEGSNATEAIRWLTAALSTPPLPSATERTRPSEVEVTEAMQRLRDMADVYGPDADDIPLDEECPATVGDLYRVLDHLRAALSTPPLPSAEPVARVCTHGRENSLFCLLCDDITREKDLLTALDFARTTGDKVALLLAYRTTPPAAAQDTGPKDEAVRWLAILLAGEYDTEWQDAEGVPLPDLSQPCRHLLDAARAAGGE